MRTTISTQSLVILLSLFVNMSNLRPVPEMEDDQAENVYPEMKTSLGRESRGVPDDNGLNAAYLEKEADQESPNLEAISSFGKDNDNIHFALDPISELFRGHKDKEVQKLPKTKQGSAQQQVVWVQDAELKSEALPTDEQDECYRQQNIEAPGGSKEVDSPLLGVEDQQFVEVPQREQRMSKPLIYKEKGTKKFGDKEWADEEITSLYSDPEKRQKMQKQKIINTPLNELEHLNPLTVYKPIGVRPEFPVYDEDIDFHPDPLQGILEDKYWLDPQEQEAVIRKYIDLANNMQPPIGDLNKRDTLSKHEPKSVDSKIGFREADAVDRECPCREIAACEDCSKGKWRKQNTTTPSENGKIIMQNRSRQLLSVSFDSEDDVEEDSCEGTALEEEEEPALKPDPNKSASQYNSFEMENLSSEELELDGNDEQESQVDGVLSGLTSNFVGRKLLSLKDRDTSIEEYGEYDDSEVIIDEIPDDNRIVKGTLLGFGDEKSGMYENDLTKRDTWRSQTLKEVDGEMNKNKMPREINLTNAELTQSFNSPVYDDMHVKEDTLNYPEHKYMKPNTSKNLLSPFSENSQKVIHYYVPNKFGNFMQKSFMKTPKEKPTTIDPDIEFEIERNETFVNVSLVMSDMNISVTTEMIELVKNEKRREQPMVLRTKGRRSYHLPILKHPPVKPLEESDNSINNKVQDVNITPNASSTTNSFVTCNSSSANPSEFTTLYKSKSTQDVSTDNTTNTAIVNMTDSSPPLLLTTPKPKKKIEDYDEDSFDAEIANDIVETVIAESQSGSVVGHNLGLYRRNDSLSKYAKISPESEQLLKKVTECILDHIRDRLEGQSCTLLDEELLHFLKWMVLSGESYKDYLARMKPELRQYKYSLYEEGPAPPPESEQFTKIPVALKNGKS